MSPPSGRYESHQSFSSPVAINARAAVRRQIGGVERLACEMAVRLPPLRPDRYRVIAPSPALAHRAGHLWEQALLPLRARHCALLYSPANLAPVTSTRNVAVIHDVAALRHPEAYSALYVGYQRRLLPVIARRARLIITVSEFSRAELVDALGVSPEQITVIPPGVDESFFAPVDRTSAIARYSLQRPYVLVVGTFSARKNLGVLTAAANALRERGIDVVIAGADRGYLRGVHPRLRRLGYVPQNLLAPLYAGARALAMPSLYEGFGLPCLEAMASGIPVVAASAGALPETVGEAALLVDPSSATDFAEALLSAACDEEVRARLAAAGSRRAERYPWSLTAVRTDEAIGKLLAAGGR